MLPHIDSVCRTGFFQLRQLRTVQGSLTTECAQTMVHSFISSHLDYCNSLLFSISAARVWNSLPTAVQSSESLDIFRRRLKTELFERSYN